jgi:asparagine synthase (glutamine-hydrolysing)
VPADIDTSVAALHHRGPDGRGTCIHGTIALGHTRLAILDLSEAGAQPMRSADGRLVITFNGEIYNFAELRRDLEQRGVRLRGRSDTEILLESYRLHGPDVLANLNGIFALGIGDLETRELLVVRDPLGVKPLYVSEGTFGFAFASEIKALLAIAPIDRAIDPIALRQYLTFLWSPGERTMLRNVRKLDPGRALIVRDGRVLSSWRYWRPSHYAPRRDWTPKECADELAHRLEDAVHRQMISDAPLGSFLSGGVDSTSIVAAARMRTPDLSCFTMAIQGEGFGEMADDLPYARLAAKALGVRLTEVSVTAEDIVAGIERMVADLEEPLADPACLNLRLISEQARATGIKVLLSGTGGDDLLSGYRRHSAAALDHLWSYAPRPVRSALARFSAAPFLSRRGLRRLAKLLHGANRPSDARIAYMFAWVAPQTAASLLAPALRPVSDDEQAFDPLMAELASLSPTPGLERCLALDQRFFLADHNLIYTDKMGMAVGVEIRVPFLDLELVSFAAAIPAEWKLRRMTPKWLFKQSQRGRVPDEVLTRSKAGFGVPLRKWMKGPLQPLCRDLLSPETLSRRGLLDPGAVARLVDADAAGHVDASYTLFSIMCIEMWSRRFSDGSATATFANSNLPAAARLGIVGSRS